MDRSTGFKAALVLVAAPVALAVGGCGGSGGVSSARSARRTSASAVAAGCTAALPRAIAASPVGWSTVIRICASTDGSKLLLDNTSMAVVLRVTGTTTATTLQQQGGGGSATSLADRIAAHIAPAACGAGACVVPPGHQLLASGSPASIDFFAVRVTTLAVSAARSYAAWVQEKSSRASRLSGQIAGCAKQTGAAGASESTPWFVAFQRAYRTGTPCGRLVTTAMADAGTGERPSAEVFENLARHVDEGAWNDAVGYGVARVVAR